MPNYLQMMTDMYLEKSSKERDIALGHYLYEWGKLEIQLLYLFHMLSETKWTVARIIFSVGLQSNNLSSILQALGQLCLDEPNRKELNNLCDNYTTAARKRNKIIHGIWDIEPDYKEFPFAQWTRICYPTDPAKEKLLHDQHNQSVRGKYAFTIKELNTASSEVKILANKLNKFASIILNQRCHQEGA
jgi:hypothetical protein